MKRYLAILASLIAIARLHASWIIRQPTWMIQDVLMVVAFAVILSSWGGSRGIEYVVSGGIVSESFSIGINMVGQEVGFSRITRTLDLYLASPISPRIFAAGVFLGSSLFMMPSLLVYTAIAWFIGKPWLTLYSMIISLPLMMLSTLIGLAIAFSIKKPGNISAITNPISFISTALPPVLYPATIIPEPLRVIAISVPTASAASIARTLGGIETGIDPTITLAILSLWIIAAVIAINKVKIKIL